MAEWAALPTELIVLIAQHIEVFEDYLNFYEVCKSWHSVTSILGTFRTLPSRFPFVMLTDKAEINYPQVAEGESSGDMLANEVRKNKQIEEGIQNRQFYSFLTSKVYEFELPEATRKKCLGVAYGLLLTVDYDLQINILNPFTRRQIGLPDMLSFKTNYKYTHSSPQTCVFFFVCKVAMSSNPYRNEDCIVMAIYGERQILGFARPGDKAWTDIHSDHGTFTYEDVTYYNGKFYAVNWQGFIDVCDINDAKATPIACAPDSHNHKYLVESSGDLLLVIRYRQGPMYSSDYDVDLPYNYTYGFSIFKLEECEYDGDGTDNNNYPYKLTEVKNLGNEALFIGNNASVSVPCSRCVKANSIYFSDNNIEANSMLPYGGGYDTGIYDVESGDITLHYASKFMSHLTPSIWIIP